jgi:CBS domain-containing protein
MTIGVSCNRDVITLQRENTIRQAAKLMRQHHVGDVVVVEIEQHKARPIGIVTDRDLVVEVVATGLDADVITVGDIMLNNLTTVEAHMGIFEAIEKMASKGVRRLPVVDEAGYLLGIVTYDDLLHLLAKELGALDKLVTKAQKNEVMKRR